MTNEELEKLVFNRNNEIGFQAFLELEKRGAKASNSLMHIIQRNMAVAPDVFVDMYTTQEAVRILAAQKDKSVNQWGQTRLIFRDGFYMYV